jgi:hypothetical protein
MAAELPALGAVAIETIALDFYTTLAMSNRDSAGGVAPANGCFAYLPVAADPVTSKPRGADLHTSFHGQQMTGPALQPILAADGQLRDGGVEYLQLDATPGASEIAFAVEADPASMPRVRVGRIR